MATSKSLQKPEILAIEGSVFRVRHPDITGYFKTYLGAQIAAAGTGMSVYDNNGFADNDWFIIGEVGDEKSEECDVNGAVTRGTSVTVTNTLKFAHEVDAPVYRILERGVKIYGAATDGGSGTLIASIDAITASGTQLADAVNIKWNKPYTEYNLITTDTTYNYYFAKFTDGVTDSDPSDYVLAAGLGTTTAKSMIQNALDITGAEPSDTGEITWPFLLRSVQDWQDYVTQWTDPSSGVKKDWSWEYIQDDTSLAITEMEDEYALSGLSSEMKYPETKQSQLNIWIGPHPTKYIPVDVFDRYRNGVLRTTVNTAITASDASIVLDNTYILGDTTGTVLIGADTITYTGNTEASGTLTGCSDVDNSHAVGAAVWQGTSGGKPYEWTIYNEILKLKIPPSSTYVGYPIKCKYIKKLTAITELTDTTEIPFFNTAQYYIAYKIELKRGNASQADYYRQLADKVIDANAKSDKAYTTETYEYYNFREGYPDIRNQNWNSDIFYLP
jgi:hypothetical protein|tara:strand:+ start:14522 stop:16024 length:1503 start_codon:yes stop_codon:yes gene_type:complete